jgi:formylmethanofuran dehydrogenase subunit E
MKKYRVRVAGKIFENADPRILVKRAVAAKKSHQTGIACKNCGERISEFELEDFGYCFRCIEQAISVLQSQKQIAV